MKKILSLLAMWGLFSIALQAQEVRFHGTVTDESGAELIGATVFIPELQKGTVSSNNGSF